MLGAGPASADPAADALAQIAQCASIAEPTQRLQCFDRFAAVARGALEPKPADFGKPASRPQEVDQLTASVRELSRTARGKALFVLDNGQVWRQLDGDDSQILDPVPGRAMKITIVRGLFDSYNLTIEGRNGLVKVRRVE